MARSGVALLSFLLFLEYVYRVWLKKREMEKACRLAENRIKKGEADLEYTQMLAQQFAQIASKQFDLAEKGQQIFDTTNSQQSADYLGIWTIRKRCKKIFLFIDEAGCFAEDFVETLALSASAPFAALVRQEVDA